MLAALNRTLLELKRGQNRDKDGHRDGSQSYLIGIETCATEGNRKMYELSIVPYWN